MDGGAADRFAVTDDLKVVQNRAVEATLGYDPQRAGGGLDELSYGPVGVSGSHGILDRGVQDGGEFRRRWAVAMLMARASDGEERFCAGELEHSANAPIRAVNDQAAVGRASAPLGADQEPHPSRIEEEDPTQVERDLRQVRARPLEREMRDRRRRAVKLTSEADDRPALVVLNSEAQVVVPRRPQRH
jgi:hypothetical protein